MKSVEELYCSFLLNNSPDEMTVNVRQFVTLNDFWEPLLHGVDSNDYWYWLCGHECLTC